MKGKIFMRDKQKLIQECMDRAVENQEVAGVIALEIKDGKEIFFAKSGYADIKNNIPIGRDNIFRLYSQSKPITATAAMMLIEDGILDLGEPVGNYIESYNKQTYLSKDKVHKVPEENKMRIRELLNMTSGLVYPGLNTASEVEVGRLMNKMEKKLGSDKMMTTMEFADELGKIPLNFIPGSHFQYGTSADVLGAVIEKASGMSFGDFVRSRILEPLDMKDTDFYVPDSKKDRLVKAYRFTKGKLCKYSGDHLAIRNNGDPNPFESGGAGLFSTIDDYAHFGQMLLNGGTYEGKQLLTPNSVKYLTSGKLNGTQQLDLQKWQGLEGYTYGNLMRVLDDPRQASLIANKGEYGWDGWLGAHFSNDPETNTTFLMMVQRYDYGTGPLTRKLKNIIFS